MQKLVKDKFIIFGLITSMAFLFIACSTTQEPSLSSSKNESAIWQHTKAKESLDSLDKELSIK